jgi:hypothetical protein
MLLIPIFPTLSGNRRPKPARMNIQKKLEILAGAAKYDVACASSGSRRENRGGRLGYTAPSGICHSFTEDGRCVSLQKSFSPISASKTARIARIAAATTSLGRPSRRPSWQR